MTRYGYTYLAYGIIALLGLLWLANTLSSLRGMWS